MIDIIIATYNGAQFLPSQLDSIIAQKYTDWRILLRDDGSSDATIEILKDYSERLQGNV
jgi:glycosyltransferase involved in cell wall biosynthesis